MNRGMLLRKFYKRDDMLWIYRFQSNITLSIWPAFLMNRGMLLRQFYKRKMMRSDSVLWQKPIHTKKIQDTNLDTE